MTVGENLDAPRRRRSLVEHIAAVAGIVAAALRRLRSRFSLCGDRPARLSLSAGMALEPDTPTSRRHSCRAAGLWRAELRLCAVDENAALLLCRRGFLAFLRRWLACGAKCGVAARDRRRRSLRLAFRAPEGGTRLWGAPFGVGLFLATYHIAHDWYDIARLDSFFLLLIMAAAYCLRFRAGSAWRDCRRAVLRGRVLHQAGGPHPHGIDLAALAFAARRRVSALPARCRDGDCARNAGAADRDWRLVVSFFLIEVPRHVVIESDRHRGILDQRYLRAARPRADCIGLRDHILVAHGSRCGALLYGAAGRRVADRLGGARQYRRQSECVDAGLCGSAIAMPLGLAWPLRACGNGRLEIC